MTSRLIITIPPKVISYKPAIRPASFSLHQIDAPPCNLNTVFTSSFYLTLMYSSVFCLFLSLFLCLFFLVLFLNLKPDFRFKPRVTEPRSPIDIDFQLGDAHPIILLSSKGIDHLFFSRSGPQETWLIGEPHD